VPDPVAEEVPVKGKSTKGSDDEDTDRCHQGAEPIVASPPSPPLTRPARKAMFALPEITSAIASATQEIRISRLKTCES
jgi:hypothetical protein